MSDSLATTLDTFSESEKLILVLSVMGATRTMQTMDDLVAARMAHQNYELFSSHITASGGDVIKYLGDGCLSLYEPGMIKPAIEALEHLRVEFLDREKAACRDTDLCYRLHIGQVVIGEFGPAQQRDVIGKAVNATFRLGSGAGFTISERAYRRLPDDQRAVWTKLKPPVNYTRAFSPPQYRASIALTMPASKGY